MPDEMTAESRTVTVLADAALADILDKLPDCRLTGAVMVNSGGRPLQVNLEVGDQLDELREACEEELSWSLGSGLSRIREVFDRFGWEVDSDG